VAACSFFASLFRKNPMLITSNQGLSVSTAAAIRNTAKLLVFDSLSKWFVGKYVPNSGFTYTIGTGMNQVHLQNEPTFRDSFIWDFGDGTTSTSINPSHSYALDGTYTVKLSSTKCFLGQNLTSTFSRTVTFCSHTPTIFPNLLLCPNEKDTLWTQPANSYQWCDGWGNPIAGATNRWILGTAGYAYSVLATVNGCTERSASVDVDVWVDNPDCSLGIRNPALKQDLNIHPNPAGRTLTIQSKSIIRAVKFSNLTGQELTVIERAPGNYDVSGLQSGMYMVTVLFGDGRQTATKFVKQ
jgi:hypothetical protein